MSKQAINKVLRVLTRTEQRMNPRVHTGIPAQLIRESSGLPYESEAPMVKLVDTRDLKSLGLCHAGSIPAQGTNKQGVHDEQAQALRSDY